MEAPAARRTRFRADVLQAFVRDAMGAVGVSEDDAAIVADVLVASDLRGIESHGVARLERFYVDRLRDGLIDPRAQPVTIRETATSLAVDANNGLGHPAAVKTMRRTIRKALESGCSVATVRRSNHFGIAGYYAMMALEHDLVGIASTNAGKLAVPTFGRTAMLGTNPFAYAIPAQNGDAFVLDMATTAVALGKLEIARRLGKPLAPGWALDAGGSETLDPQSGINGSLLPLGGFGTEGGGHKGYGLALLAEILCGVLAGGVYGPEMPDSQGVLDPAITSHFFAAFRIDGLRDAASFKADLSRLLEHMRACEPAAGCERVYTAGEIEAIRTRESLEHGIALDPVVVATLDSVAKKLKIPPPQRIAS
jgi:LDH2 family malate/lactate/ureidoglycolate dehydrogenase